MSIRPVEAAHQALYGGGRWARMTATQRGKLLYRLADLIARERAETGGT